MSHGDIWGKNSPGSASILPSELSHRKPAGAELMAAGRGQEEARPRGGRME